MDHLLLSKAKKFFMGGGSADPFMEELGPAGEEKKTSAPAFEKAKTEEEISSSAIKALTGALGGLRDYYFPANLIGGCCPRVLGEEQELVWNAAAEASDTERVHIVWQAKGEKVWYLAIRSAEMSSHAGTWCPFASLLPGTKDSADPPVIFTYFSDETATMMSLLPDGLQIHRGTSSVIRAKAERMARELGDAPVVELVPDRIQKLSPVPWFSISLFEERARRILAALSVFGAFVVAGLSVFVWLVAAMSTVSSHADFAEIQRRADDASLKLLKDVQEQRASPMREQLAEFANVNDGLLALNGYLEVYQIVKNKPQWRAIIPANVTSDRIKELGGMTLDSNEQGVVIGNVKELDEGNKSSRRKRRNDG